MGMGMGIGHLSELKKIKQSTAWNLQDLKLKPQERPDRKSMNSTSCQHSPHSPSLFFGSCVHGPSQNIEREKTHTSVKLGKAKISALA